MSKLYDIANDYAKLMDSGLEPDMIADTIEGINGEMVDKVEQLLAICKNEQLYAEALRNESKSLLERASVVESKISSIKEYIARSLETAGKKSIRAGIHQVTVRVPSRQVDITDASILPIEFVEYETLVKPDKLAIKHRLDAGISVPGAQIKLGKPSLIIR
ncbi:Siphovirus Gp157 [Serratia marcescens]|uniref:siphovirus Gp157 family protein n=1 Tax=Serratia marcescens TaxID=615 RepID=UPI0007453BE4|nr:siphovirus Gp157 family protein [Serratia marcescens]CUZ82635.1 Siphovirus Gp157 [Serratia marcescens]CVA50758.1 Siphovirus Gp157 [Serratia marcescens]CVA77125.1 Siphovirus Gp157 [Serratia marcescens]CVH12776.1 Siphovirus Gp157 [Serratia marcescens]